MAKTSSHKDSGGARTANEGAPRTTRDLTRAAVSGWLGTALEFMDFQLYSLAAALVFSQLFFTTDDPAVAVIAAMATYGVGYIARPVGAWFFGRIGDRLGRKKVLYWAIIIMGTSTTLIGALPTYEQVGLLAPLLLVILRLAQGFGAGAEISTTGVMLAEYAPVKRRGVIASLVALGTNCGTLAASGIWALLLFIYTEDQLVEWAWRIPFLGSALLLLFAVWLRARLKESPVFEERADVVDGKALSAEEAKDQVDEDPRIADAMTQKPYKAIAVAFFLRFGQAGNSGLIQTYLISFITVTMLMSRSVGTTAVLLSSLAAFITVPLIGWLGDLFGRRRMYIILTIISILVVTPLIWLISSGNESLVTLAYIAIHNISVMSLASLENLTLPEIFGSRNRNTNTAVTREISAMIATGIGPSIAAALVAWATGSWIPIAIMIALFSLSSLIAAILMPEVTGRDLKDPRNAL